MDGPSASDMLGQVKEVAVESPVTRGQGGKWYKVMFAGMYEAVVFR